MCYILLLRSDPHDDRKSLEKALAQFVELYSGASNFEFTAHPLGEHVKLTRGRVIIDTSNPRKYRVERVSFY